MNTKFFFSAIALFAITSVANALPIGQHVKFPQVNEEVATSAVIKGAEVTQEWKWQQELGLKSGQESVTPKEQRMLHFLYFLTLI